MLEASSIGVCGGVSIGEILDDRSVLMCRFNPDVKSRKLNRRKTSLVNCVDVVVFVVVFILLYGQISSEKSTCMLHLYG